MSARDRQRQREYIRALRASRVAARRCIFCDAGLQEDDGKLCIECTEKNRESSRRYRRSARGVRTGREWAARRRVSHRDEVNAEHRARRLEKKINGICVVCKEPASETSVLCEGHREYRRVRRLERIARRRKDGANVGR